LAAAAVLLVSASPAAADKFADCSAAKAEVRIRACSEVIEAPTFRSRAIPQSDLAIAYSNRGTAFIAKGDYERAIADFDTAIRLNPKNTNAYFHRGVVYDEKGSPDLAIPQYDKTIELKPDHGYAYCRRAAARRTQAGLTSNTASKKRWLLERSRADWRSAVAKITRQDKWQKAAKAEFARAERLLASSGTPPEPKPARPVNTNWSDRTVCILALDAGKSRLGAGEGPEAQEFSRRGLSVEKCRSTLGLPKTETSATAGELRTVNSNWSDRAVCILADSVLKVLQIG
jgi:tetratricopeptide (TPR) repeat protein